MKKWRVDENINRFLAKNVNSYIEKNNLTVGSFCKLTNLTRHKVLGLKKGTYNVTLSESIPLLSVLGISYSNILKEDNLLDKETINILIRENMKSYIKSLTEIEKKHLTREILST